jgi:hypothetical protein
MIPINPAFEYLRQFKPVGPETETLVLKKTRGTVSSAELMTIFENGMAGQYGKVYQLDPPTLMGWVDKYLTGKEKSANYLSSPLMDPTEPVTSIKYPRNQDEWKRETNKAYHAYLNGVSHDAIHPHLYHHLVCDNRIQHNDMSRRMPKGYADKWDPEQGETDEMKRAYRASITHYFAKCKSYGWSQIYQL